MGMLTQRVIIPGGVDRVTCPVISRQAFERMSWGRKIWLGREQFVFRGECFWDSRHDTISLLPGLETVVETLNGGAVHPGADAPEHAGESDHGDESEIQDC